MSKEVALSSPWIGPRRRVTATVSRSRALSGYLSREWSYIALSPGDTMVRSWLLTFDSAQVLSKGDSGAWVTDNETSEVYGHVVASDSFGRAHVILMRDIFSDISSRLSFPAVRLTSRDDILSLLRVEAEFNIPPTVELKPDGYSLIFTSRETTLKSSNPHSTMFDTLNDLAGDTQFGIHRQSPAWPTSDQSSSLLPRRLSDYPGTGEGYIPQSQPIPREPSQSIPPPMAPPPPDENHGYMFSTAQFSDFAFYEAWYSGQAQSYSLPPSPDNCGTDSGYTSKHCSPQVDYELQPEESYCNSQEDDVGTDEQD